jgi:cytidylate kinase
VRAPGVVTFDGPAASGKSTVARRVAAALGWPFVSSGLLYRAATALVLRASADPDDVDAIVATLERHSVTLLPGLAGDVLTIDGRDAAADVQTHDVDRVVSRVARHPRVRAWVLARLREMPVPFVIDGRDMGSVVFPNASAKFYLDAAPDVRAARRLGERGANLAEITAALRRRDEADAAQLLPAADAMHLDTGPLTLEEVVGWVLRRLDERAR